MPATVAPRRAMASARMPPPHPTSSTRLPASAAWRSIQSRRKGLMSCSGRNSPCGSHQRCASWLNFSSSAGSAFTPRLSQKKTPPKRGFFRSEDRSVLARADDFDLGAAVLRAALGRLVVRDRLLLALALGIDAVAFDALRHEVGLHRFGPAHGERLVVGVASDGIGVPNGDHHLEVDALHLVRQVVELRLA